MNINWQQIASLAELGGNIALTFLGGAGIVPVGTAALASGIEAAFNPLLTAIEGKQPVQADIQAGYGALIGSLSVLKTQTGIAPDLLTKIDEYLAASNAGLTAYTAEQAGFNANLFVVNAPLTPAAS